MMQSCDDHVRGGVVALSTNEAPKKAVNRAMTLAPLTAAAVATAFIMYPADVARALKMSSAGSKEPFSLGKHYQKFGVRGFVSQGVIPEIVKSSVMRVSKFFFFPIMCDLLHGRGPKDCTPLEKGLAGASATVPEILAISPLEVSKLMLQLDSENKYKNNSRVAISEIYKTRGLSGLYSGWAGMQWRQSFWTGTYFATLAWWKKTVEPPLTNVGVPQPIATLVSGFLAGFFATFPNAPGDVVRSVVQKRMFLEPNRKAHGISLGGIMEHIEVGGNIIRSSGVRGLYSGLGFKAIHLGGSGALM